MDKEKLELDLAQLHNLLELIFALHNDHKAACTLAQAAQDKLELIKNDFGRE